MPGEKNFQLVPSSGSEVYNFENESEALRFIDEHEVAAFELWQVSPRRFIAYGKTPVRISRAAK